MTEFPKVQSPLEGFENDISKIRGFVSSFLEEWGTSPKYVFPKSFENKFREKIQLLGDACIQQNGINPFKQAALCTIAISSTPVKVGVSLDQTPFELIPGHENAFFGVMFARESLRNAIIKPGAEQRNLEKPFPISIHFLVDLVRILAGVRNGGDKETKVLFDMLSILYEGLCYDANPTCRNQEGLFN